MRSSFTNKPDIAHLGQLLGGQMTVTNGTADDEGVQQLQLQLVRTSRILCAFENRLG